MRVLYYDCFAGISGDMNLGALVDAGVDPAALTSELRKLPLEGWELVFERAARGGVWGTLATVHLAGEAAADKAHRREYAHGHAHTHAHDAPDTHGHGHDHTHRSHADIRAMIEHSALSENVKTNALKIFQRLAEAEAQVHNRPVEQVRFHEVGAVDSIIDIVGAAVGLELLGVDAVTGSAVELGGGTVRCAHGVLPVPAPATAILAKAFPVKLNGAPHECTTPTGAAILAALGAGFGAPLAGRVCATGVGIGHRDCPELPNFVRVMLCESQETSLPCAPEEALCESAANIDDMTGEQLAALAENLFAAGALDAWQEGICMKKGRLAAKVSALCRPGDLEKIRAAFFTHSTSLGVRTHSVRRAAVGREHFERDSAFGKVRFKKSAFKNIVRVKPEADDCLRIARETGLPVDLIAQKLSHDDPAKN